MFLLISSSKKTCHIISFTISIFSKILRMQVEVLKKKPEIKIKYSSTMRKKVKYDDMLDTTKLNLKLGIPPSR